MLEAEAMADNIKAMSYAVAARNAVDAILELRLQNLMEVDHY